MRFCEINDIASVASELADGLRARGHVVEVIRPRLFGGSLPWTVKPVVGPVRAIEWAQMIRQVHAGHFDMVHIHYAYLGMVGILGQFPYILHCHGSDVREIRPYTRHLVERAIDGAARVYYATPDLEHYVRGRRRDATFLPNPVDTQLFRPLAPVCDNNSVLVCCSLSDIKGAGRILSACRILAERRPDIPITVTAGGEHTAAFADLPNVRVVPYRARNRLPELISEHGIVVGQVLLGALGMAELESIACGRPLVAWFRYDRSYPEPVPMLRALDGRDIAEAVIRLADDPMLRERLGSQGRDWVARHHSLAAAARAVEHATLEILGRGVRLRSAPA
jgi:glycosyltransferase involved in cell wall biosynthesis